MYSISVTGMPPKESLGTGRRGEIKYFTQQLNIDTND